MEAELLDAAWSGKLDDVRRLIKEKLCDPVCRDEDGETALHKAAFRGHLQVMKFFVEECGIAPESCRDNKGRTPLYLAAQGEELDIMRYLIKEKHCDPMCRDENGKTALHKAAYHGHLKVMKFFIEECGIDPESCRDDKGQTPLHTADQPGQKKKLDTVRYLVKEKHCDPMCRDDKGWTALHTAAYYGHLQVVKFFIEECGMDPESCRDNKGQTPLHQSVQNQKLDMIRYLIKVKHCDPMCRDEDGETALHEAAYHGHLQVVKFLIEECGIDPESCQDDKRRTPLHLAVRERELDIMKYLIKEKHCDPMCWDKDGWTVLHFAYSSSCFPAIKYLIEQCGVDPSSCELTELLGSDPKIWEYLISKQGSQPRAGNGQKVSTAPKRHQDTVSSDNLPPPKKTRLESHDLHQLSIYLHQVPNEDLIRLGLALGLNYDKLKRLEGRGNFLLDMLSMWLRGEDNVTKVGPPTWKTLVKALRVKTVSHNGIAQSIEKDHL